MTPFSTAARALTELTDSQLLALQALLAGATQAEAAAAARAGERSVRRWLHDPVFRSALHQARCDAWNTVTARLQRAAAKAVATLEALLEGDHQYARALAARAILEYAHRALDADDLVARAAQLEADFEAHFQAQAPGPPPGSGPPPSSAPPAPSLAVSPETPASCPDARSSLRREVRRPLVPAPAGPLGPLPAAVWSLRRLFARRSGPPAAARDLRGVARYDFARLALGLAPSPPPAG